MIKLENRQPFALQPTSFRAFPVHPYVSMELSEIRAPVAEDMQAVDRLILKRLESDVALINQIGHYIVSSGGKRLRPLAVLLAARACGYQGSRHTDLAAVVEFIHTATLLHDDVVDGSELRRNHETCNAVWGNEASVLVGDFLYSRAFEMMVDLENIQVMDTFSHATNRIAQGEVLQLINRNDPDTTEAQYMRVIRRKTATLFEAGTRLGAVLAQAPNEIEDAAAQYGLQLGIAFQLVDDALDYRAEDDRLGKNLGDDLAEGKPTLPIIRAMEVSTGQERELLRQAVENGGADRIDAVFETIESTKAIDYTISVARRHAEIAKELAAGLPESAQRTALKKLADFAVSRTY